ncbi:GWxTD domain-containing protein, partial [bacterium]|nr:GWxTD domain-containing protein [bacterium]
SGKKGWKTDRGRVVLIYGLPDEIEHFTFNSTSKPYQIWHYFSAEGGIKFIFVDKRLFGNFELVHSTARKEIYDKDWERWISPTKETSPSILRFEQQNATTTP